MYEFWYDYITPKYYDKATLCYIDTAGFVMHIKTEDFYKDIAGDVERWFDTSNYDEKDKRLLPIGKNKNVIGLFKDEVGGKIMTEFCAYTEKTYAYKLDDDTEMKKAKGTKKCIVKREITFKNYADGWFNDEVIIRSQLGFRSEHHKVCTEEVNKIALSTNDDKRIQTFDKVTTFHYGTNVFKVCENEMLLKTTKHKHSVEEREEMNMPIIESNRAGNDLFAKYDDDDDDDDDDFDDLDDEWNELTKCHSDIDTEDEMIEGKIDDGTIKDVIHKIDDETDDETENMIEEEQKDMLVDNKERKRHLDMINERIYHVNLLARIRNDFSKNVEEICRLMNELHGEVYSDDSWLRLVGLNKINVLLDEALDYVWKTIYDKNREKHERINVDKYKDIDGYVTKYANIVNNKLELVNRIGEILDSAMIEVQNEVDMINEVKKKECEIDIETLKLMHETLAKISKKWIDVILEMINRDSACSKPDTKKKDNKADAKKKDNK